MNTGKKRLMTLGMGLVFIAPQTYTANNDVSQLDQTGINLIIELTKAYNHFVETTKKPDFDFSRWNFLLNPNIKGYVEDYSKAAGIQDKDLMHSLNLLLQTNDELIQHIKKLKNYEFPKKAFSDAEILSLRENLKKPFLQIKEKITNQIIPELEKQSYYLSADKKNKAREILIRSFDLLNRIIRIMTLYTSSTVALGVRDSENV